MNPQIFCQMSGCGCDHPQRCQQVCEATLTTGNGGNVITHGKPLPPREELPIQFVGREPRWYETFPIVRWCFFAGLAVIAFPRIFQFVLSIIRNA